MEIRILRGHEVSNAIQLIQKVFFNDIASTYSKEGVDTFLETFKNENILSLMQQQHLIMIGAFDQDLIGVIGIKDLNHIHSLFVDKDYQRQHIGSLLLDYAKKLMYGKISVHASKQALLFYEKQGFQAIDDEVCESGIKFIPMIYQSENCHQFTTYDQVHEFIASQKDRVYALDNFRNFMNDMCNPQKLLKTIHIGGTNGKGSTTNYVRSVLQEEGYKVATFTTPVLVTRLEVMRINNQHINDEEII